jgi:hypothetical protein
LAFQTACENGIWKLHNTLLNVVALTNNKCELLLDACSSSGSNKAVVNWLMSTLKLTQQERDSWMLTAAVARGDTLHDIQLLVGKVGKHSVEAMSRALLTASNKNRVDVVDWLTTHTAADASIKMKCEDEC